MDALEAEADLMSLSLRYKLQLNNYASRILNMTNHPLCLLIHDYNYYQLYNDSPHPLPVVGQIRRIFEDIGLPYMNIPALSQSSKYAINDVPCQCSMLVNQKGRLSGQQWKQIFADLQSYSTLTFPELQCSLMALSRERSLAVPYGLYTGIQLSPTME